MTEGEHPVPELQLFVATLRARLAEDGAARRKARREILAALPG